jgi:group II intron reverse transcriptase/maturase
MTSGREVRLTKTLHSVIDKVYCLENLRLASARVCSNKGAAGLDGMSVQQWRNHEEQNLAQLRRLLLEDRYRAKPVKRAYIPKPGSSQRRPLGIPVVGDRVCQMAVAQKLSPVFEETFFEDSHGFRPNRSTHSAARRIEELKRQGYRHVVDLDIENFFGCVDHEVLLRLVRKVVKDRRVLGLIRGWLKAGVMEEGLIRYETSGTPQGGVISPLLSNIYLTPFDLEMKAAGWNIVRYADDVLILCRSREEAESALELARNILDRLKLRLSESKTKVSSFQEGFDFLGFHFKSRSRGVGKKSLRSFYDKIREATRRQQGNRPMVEVIADVNPVVRGWWQYHRRGKNLGLFRQLDKWVRNRVRAYVRRRWRDRGRWKLFSAAELAKKGLLSLHLLSFGTGQLELFRGSP